MGRVSQPQFLFYFKQFEDFTSSNKFLFRDHMLEKLERKLEIIYWLNKFRLRDTKFPQAGVLKVLISLTDLFKGNLKIGWA